jgi:sugar phosphate isomerase/epimerase
MNRRNFINTAVASLGSVAVSSLPAATAPSHPRLTFPVAARERLAVASYPFRKFLNLQNGNMQLVDFPAMVVSRFGVKGIEPLYEHFPSTGPNYLAQFKEALAKSGAHVVNIPVSSGTSLYDPDPQKQQNAIGTTKKWIDVAVALGSPSIRLNLVGVPHVEPDAQQIAKNLDSILRYAREKNIVVDLENDDPHTEKASFIVKLINLVDNAYLHALPDFCNSMIEKGGDESFNYQAVQSMFSKAYNISHVKDSELDGKTLYRIDVAKCFTIAKQSGYKGYFSMEWEGASEPYGGTQKLVELSLKNLS